jgi:hypothetical protein
MSVTGTGVANATVVSAINYDTGAVTLSNAITSTTAVSAFTFSGTNSMYVRSETGQPFKNAVPGRTVVVTSSGVTDLVSSAPAALLPAANSSKEFVVNSVVAGGSGIVFAYASTPSFTSLPINSGYVTFYGGSVTATSTFLASGPTYATTVSLTSTGSATVGTTIVNVNGTNAPSVGLAVSGSKIPLGTVVSTTALYGTTSTAVTLSKAITGTISSGSTIKFQGAANIFGTASTPSLKIKAKGSGIWSNNIWVTVTPNSTPNYFDLKVYYSLRTDVLLAQGSQALLDSELVETFAGLSLNPAETTRYASVAVQSDWVTVTVIDRTDTPGTNSTGSTPISSAKRIPSFTRDWTADAGSTGVFVWNAGYTTFGTFDTNYTNDVAFNLGDTAYKTIYNVTAPLSATVDAAQGSQGSTSVVAADMLDQLNLVTSPLVINFPGSTGASRINSALTWAANRGDSFVVIDPVKGSTVSEQLSTIAGYSSSSSYGAAYYPYLDVDDASSTLSAKTVSIAPGGAVSAVIVSNDANYGPYKSPAGVSKSLYGAVPTKALSQSEFDSVFNSRYNINVIRSVPSSGT